MGLDALQQNMQSPGLAGINRLAGNSMFPQSQQVNTQFATPSQMPTSTEVMDSDYDAMTDSYTGMPTKPFAKGGDVELRENQPDYNVRAMAMTAIPEYNKNTMPLRVDNRPLSSLQAALLRMQLEGQIGNGQARVGASGLATAIPGQQGVSVLPGAFDVGYNMATGLGNLDISAFRAMRGTPDGKVPYGINARYSIPFASGGIADIPHYDGEDGSVVEDPAQEDPTFGNKDLTALANNGVDADTLQQLNTLKAEDPAAYNSQLMQQLGTNLKQNYNGNENYDALLNQIQSMKDVAPKDYYGTMADFYGHQMGWQVGQNTSERNAPVQSNLQGLLQDAQKAGMDPNQLDAIAGNAQQSGNIQNQNRIINQQQAGGGAFGMTPQDYMTVAAILGSGAAAAYFAPLAAAEAGAGGFGLSAAGTGGTYGSIAAPSLATGLELGAAGTGTAIGGAGGYGITAASVPSLATGLEVGTAGALAGAAPAGGTSLKDAYQAYKYANQAKNVLGSLSGGEPANMYGNPGINNQYAMSSGFTPSANYSFGLPGASNQRDYANNFNPLAAPKLTNIDFDRDTRYMAAGGMASGGIASLGSYSDGGRMLKGPGDGMSDNIPATIGGTQPARLADSEFVLPADIVSHLGNGSTDAGAKVLYKMMDRIRKARTGTTKQGKQINPNKFLPKG